MVQNCAKTERKKKALRFLYEEVGGKNEEERLIEHCSCIMFHPHSIPMLHPASAILEGQ